MLKNKRNLVLDIFDYAGNKQCSLYDETSDASGQASDVVVTSERNGWKEINFNLPQYIHTENKDEDNYRVKYIKEGYRIRLKDDYETDWFIISESKVTHNSYAKKVNVTAGHVSQLLKHKRLDLEFSDDEGNNVGTAAMLLDCILEGTGWKAGHVEEFLEKNGNVKYRSMKASTRTGAFKLIANMCDLFEAKPIYHGDTKTVDIVPLNPFSIDKNTGLPGVGDEKYYKDLSELNNNVVELHYGSNVSNVVRTLNEEELITKLYAYGSFGEKETGYCGIDECTHHVYKLVINEPCGFGTECNVNFADEYGIEIFKFFTIGNGAKTDTRNTQKISHVYWSDLDPASRMYVWDDVNKCAYFLYDNKQGTEDTPYFREDEEARREETNYFSFLMDFNYYKDIGLLTDDMLQEIAKYQVEAPAAMKIVNDKATVFSDALTNISEIVGAIDFCKLSCSIIKQTNGHVQLRLNTQDYPKGVIYRTDYTKKEEKQFKWRVAEELKGNGDPVTEYAAMVYIIYEPSANSPAIVERAYLKEIDNADDPTMLTLWLTSDKCHYTNQQYRVYLFPQRNLNGLLGALEISDEALVMALDDVNKNITKKHPVFYQTTALGCTTSDTNGYAWWWKYYEDNTPSELYFCWNDIGDTSWKRVTIDANDPSNTAVNYWFNYRTAVLWRWENGVWVAKNEISDYKNVAALFNNVNNTCKHKDQLYKGVYQKQTYTATASLPAGNYAMETDAEHFHVFTTEAALSANDTLTYDSTQDTVTQKVGQAETVLESKNIPKDSVSYHLNNVAANASVENGSIKDDDGSEVPGDEMFRTGFIRVYPNIEYIYDRYNGYFNVYYYDENRRYIGCDKEVYGEGDSKTTPGGIIRSTEVGEVTIGKTKYIRLTGSLEIVPEEISVHAVNAENKIILPDEETYTVLSGFIGSGRLKGITPLTKLFADSADEAYGDHHSAMKKAQETVRNLEISMSEALGDLYREGFWQKNDYVDGDEQRLYDDALDNLTKLSKPEARYDITYLDLYGANYDNADNAVDPASNKILWPDISTASAAHLVDPEIGINTWAFVDKVQKCYDQPWKTKIAINTNLTTISQHSFMDIVSHIADVSKETKGKMSIYDRAAVIKDNGYLTAERLEGTINANKLKITGGSSTWYTDDKGNVVFESSDGNSAMMITGNGFSVANSKDEWGKWNWRVFGTGDGFSADEIITGYLSANRIAAGSITTSHLDAGVAGELDISANKSLKLIVSDLMDSVDDKISSAEISMTPEEIVQKVESVESFTEKYATKEEIADTYLTKDAVVGIVGYRLEILSTTDVLSESVKTTTLTAKVWYGADDVTDTFDASSFNWKRSSGNSSEDSSWNNSHKGMKEITLTTSDVPYTATYSCELIEEEEG